MLLQIAGNSDFYIGDKTLEENNNDRFMGNRGFGIQFDSIDRCSDYGNIQVESTITERTGQDNGS